MQAKSLYVHIPFCRHKCAYCDFFSIPCRSAIPDAYIDSLLNEISFYRRKRFSADGFKTVYLGGGTPSLLSPNQLSRILGAACIPAPPEEVTVEVNPESLSEAHLEAFASCPAKRRRLSVGIQSLTPSALESVGRACGPKEARAALSLIRQHWPFELCLDLIAGLPCQSGTEFKDSLTECISYRPDHLSLYSLTLEEGTPLYRSIEGMDWDGDEADRQWLEGKGLLEAAGYVQYEVSNFCRKGRESLHNMAYWKQEDYIGIGSGATGSLYSFSDEAGIRWTNTRDIAVYTDFWHSGNGEGSIPRELERLDLAIEEEEFLMMGLRSTHGINSAEYRRRFSKLAPWKGNLEQRLGVTGGAWDRFSSLEGMAACCITEKEGEETNYSFTGQALAFLNTFLRHLT
ncbi:MAG: radical SAM family heme chaperone HemW [Treponema sp.]|nr:radical SAM family heme chaperone HemW [Treponema sp.]